MTTHRTPIYCVTAPVITAETEQAELNALSDAEREELQNDLVGKVVQLERTETEVETDLASMRHILNCMSDNEKADYVEALEKVPELVTKESPMVDFLWTERFDATAACRRLTAYWKVRKQLFGDRAFLPMRQEEGALDKEDVLTLRKQFLVVLPSDRYGRPTLWLDRARINPDKWSRDSIAMAVEADLSQLVAGCVAIINLRGYEVYKHYDRIMMKRLISTCSVMPLKIRVLHWCAGSASSALFVVLPELKFLLGKYLRQRLLIHSLSTNDLVHEFRQCGINAKVEDLLGGSYEDDESLQRLWEMRRTLEKDQDPRE